MGLPLAVHQRSYSFQLRSKTLTSLQRWTSSPVTGIEIRRGAEALLSEPSSEQELLANIQGRDVGRASKSDVDMEGPL
jgi:hypothetical protein